MTIRLWNVGRDRGERVRPAAREPRGAREARDSGRMAVVVVTLLTAVMALCTITLVGFGAWQMACWLEFLCWP